MKLALLLALALSCYSLGVVVNTKRVLREEILTQLLYY
jgi:hypothetical protein